jgi:cation diffusion facilitator CzcD-associated flavoprotein CzcO
MADPRASKGSHRRIGIIGAGPGGLCAGVRLKQAGFDDFAILEKAAGVGGTWWHNRYPGAACDVPSHLYSFSFEPKADWPRPYSPHDEIRAYMNMCADKYGLRPHLRLNTAVQRAVWDDAAAVWKVLTEHDEELTFDVLVSAMGMFNDLNWPDIPGLDGFGGTMFHSARWDHEHDLSGETVGVIGSAASAVQFVPEIAKQVGQLYMFQRTANWVLPKDDDPFTPDQIEHFKRDPDAMHQLREQIFGHIEGVVTFSDPEKLRAAEEAGLRALSVVKDPDLRRKLTPTEPYGCKRPLLSNDYYPTFNRSNVEVVTDEIERITSDAIVTRDGVQRPVDTIVVATGFDTRRFLSAIDVVGREGRKLEEAWNDGAQAYLGITTSEFPNLFMLYGPNTNNGSIIYMIECQVDYAVRKIESMSREGIVWMDVRREAMDRYNEDLQRDLDGIEVWQAGCNGYYRSPSGRIVTQWPHTMQEFHERTRRPDSDAYELHPGE